ncbi:MAG: Na+:solute symporter [Balneolia bacterium]|nr:Na+:solute symporter [Balneolia bacterium]
MLFHPYDYVVIALYAFVMLVVGWLAQRRGNKNLSDYFAGGKNLPWWVVGTSMVATTFAADTPLAVTGIVAAEGVAGNWIWWNFLFSGMLTVFVYAKLWKRADVITDVEFIEKRYSGKPAAWLRGFRAIYLAFPINCIILGWVTVGMAKILSVITPLNEWSLILILYGLTGLYIMLSGLWGVVVTDVIQFVIAMGGSILLAVIAVNHVGGIEGLKTELNLQFGEGHHYLDFIPVDNPELMMTTFLVWVGMMWWSSWYPGMEPGGGGYVAQRMFSAKNEKHAVGGTLFFYVMHFALRPWPWILVALVSLVMYPNLTDKELGYPMLMLDLLPPGLFGLLVVAFLSAFISTVSTHLNWGASYVVNDVYKRFIKPESEFDNEEAAGKHYVSISRIATLVIMGFAVLVSWYFDNVKDGWEAILALGAGTGPVYLLRWFWWRINAWSEIAAMSGAAIGVIIANMIGIDGLANTLFFTTAFTTVVWVSVTYMTKPVDYSVLRMFYNLVQPGGPGWAVIKTEDKALNADNGKDTPLFKSFSYAGIAALMLLSVMWLTKKALLG